MFSDIYDMRDSVVQLVAMQNGSCVGRTRIIFDDVPLVHQVDMSKYLKDGIYLAEVTRLAIKKELRGTELLPAICRYLFSYSRQHPEITHYFCSSLKSTARLYKKMGFQIFDTFYYPEVGKDFFAMVCKIDDILYNIDSLKDANKWVIKMITLPIEQTPLRRVVSYYRNLMYKAAFKLKI